MDKKAQLLKDIVKRNAPLPTTTGKDPNDPWSAKAGINEDEYLDKFLRMKGYNPKFLPKNTKIAHSKTGAFQRWLKNHMSAGRLPDLSKQSTLYMGEEMDKEDVVSLNIPLLIRMLEHAREDIKSDADLHRVIEKLIKIRDKGTLTMDDYDYVTSIKESIEYMFEDKFQDPQASTQTVGMEVENPDKWPSDDNQNRKQQLSKSARIIKSIYKNKKMKEGFELIEKGNKKKTVDETLYDWEKDNKSVAPYGKPPKTLQTDYKQNVGDNKPIASAVVTGGKTLTGTDRDMIEIDPKMRQQNFQSFTNDLNKKTNK